MSQSLERALDLLDQLGQRPHSLIELTESLGVHKSTVLRLLQSLESHQYARRMPNGTWGVGFGLVATAQHALDAIDLRGVARPYLLALGNELGHTIHLSQLVGNEIVYVDKVEGIGAVRMQSRIGAAAPPHTAGVAKVILAYSSPAVRTAVLANSTFQRFTATTITSPARFAAELDAIVARGWATDDGEYEDYINCVAVPIRDRAGLVSASISVTALRALAPLETLATHIRRLNAACASISTELGWVPAVPA